MMQSLTNHLAGLHDMLVSALAFGGFLVAFVVLWFMQTVTADAGVRYKLAFVQLLQRIFYVMLACALATNAVLMLNDGTLPPLRDMFVEISFFALSIVSFWRHRGAPRLPAALRKWDVKPTLHYDVPSSKPNGQGLHAQQS